MSGRPEETAPEETGMRKREGGASHWLVKKTKAGVFEKIGEEDIIKMHLEKDIFTPLFSYSGWRRQKMGAAIQVYNKIKKDKRLRESVCM